MKSCFIDAKFDYLDLNTNEHTVGLDLSVLADDTLKWGEADKLNIDHLSDTIFFT